MIQIRFRMRLIITLGSSPGFSNKLTSFETKPFTSHIFYAAFELFRTHMAVLYPIEAKFTTLDSLKDKICVINLNTFYIIN